MTAPRPEDEDCKFLKGDSFQGFFFFSIQQLIFPFSLQGCQPSCLLGKRKCGRKQVLWGIVNREEDDSRGLGVAELEGTD